MNLAAIPANDFPLDPLKFVNIGRLIGLRQPVPRQFIGDDVHEQFGQQQPGRIPEIATSIQIQLHGGCGGVDQYLALAGAVNCPVGIRTEVAEIIAGEHCLALIS